ncbi:MAG TPA: ribosome-associated translation inhibitor RaiA [Longilinea sp.]|nr:ribosome-associated translation inhibitor RaiA [Longilinea sp.]
MTIKAEIFVKNMELTDRIEEYVSKKMGKLDRFLTNVEEARVELSYTKSARSASDRQVCQITLRGRGFVLRTEERSADIFTAFDNAIEKIDRQIERSKSKRNRGRGDGTPASEVSIEPEALSEAEAEGAPVIVRRKTFTMTPMDELEAIEQMKLLGHENFFIFYNGNTNAINVLYVRRDGNYGLIEPKIG